jgi:hypothetical protein
MSQDLKDTYVTAWHQDAEALGIPDTYKGNQMNRSIIMDRVLIWEAEENSYHLVYAPILSSLKMTVSFAAHPNYYVDKDSNLDDIWICHRFYGCVYIQAPAEGVWAPLVSDDTQLCLGDKILRLDASADAVRCWKEARENERIERMRKAEEKEKEEIAKKLIERQRRRMLEQQVRLKLIETGELFGDQHRRPFIPRDVVDAVYRRDGGRCVYCGAAENLQLDHIIPFSKGGATSIENLQLLCQKCNIKKSNQIG